MDTVSPEIRHKNMSRIRSTGTTLETSLRSQLFKFGFRFRKNDRRLAGSPDIVFPRYHAVVFINGCFWHAHGWRVQIGADSAFHFKPASCTKFRFPKINTAFWYKKFLRNTERDFRDIQNLLDDGWRVCVVWECSITGKNRRGKIYDVASGISLWLEERFGERFLEL